MYWSDVLVCMLGVVVRAVLDVLAAALPSESSTPASSPPIEADHWECPSAEEIAKVCGGINASGNHNSGVDP
jgi:hypothetical protein